MALFAPEGALMSAFLVLAAVAALPSTAGEPPLAPDRAALFSKTGEPVVSLVQLAAASAVLPVVPTSLVVHELLCCAPPVVPVTSEMSADEEADVEALAIGPTPAIFLSRKFVGLQGTNAAAPGFKPVCIFRFCGTNGCASAFNFSSDFPFGVAKPGAPLGGLVVLLPAPFPAAVAAPSANASTCEEGSVERSLCGAVVLAPPSWPHCS